MTVRDLIDRAYMQVGDTSQVNYTPYQFLEFYNEGNHILHRLVARYIPDIVSKTESGHQLLPDVALSKMALRILSVKDARGNDIDYDLTAHQLVTAKDKTQRGLTVIYIPSADYKDMSDNSGYPSEMESMLVNYMVARVLKADLSFVSNWENEVSEIARQMDDENGFIARGYWPYDSRRTDYDD